MAGRLPSPPPAYDQRWGNDFVRVLDFVLDNLSQPVAVGYRAQVASPLRSLDSGNGTSAQGQVGTVQIVIAGSTHCRVQAEGVGGNGSYPSTGEIAQVLATFITDAKARGLLG